MLTRSDGRTPMNSRGHIVSVERTIHATACGRAWQGFEATMPVTLSNWRGSVVDALRDHARTMGDFETVEAFEGVEVLVTRYTTPEGNNGTHVQRTRAYYFESISA